MNNKAKERVREELKWLKGLKFSEDYIYPSCHIILSQDKAEIYQTALKLLEAALDGGDSWNTPADKIVQEFTGEAKDE